jgi:hypothetical protein
METHAHRHLKVLAIRSLLRGGCAAAAAEVRCPIARHRVDVAGYVDALAKRSNHPGPNEAVGLMVLEPGEARFERGVCARSVIIECKQSRADFLSDSRDADELIAERERLIRVRKMLEEQIVKVCEPHLRRSGTRLFADLEEWDFSLSRVGSYRAVLRDLRKIDQRLHGESKFWKLAHYRLADWLYLAAPRGTIQPRELPTGWGLLEIERDVLETTESGEIDDASGSGVLRVRVAAPLLSGNPDHRSRLLRNIAVALSRSAQIEAMRPMFRLPVQMFNAAT